MSNARPKKDLDESGRFLRKEIERIDKLSKKLGLVGDKLHPISHGFLEQMVERRAEYYALVADVERALQDLEQEKSSKKK